jgi:hypothetical protein
MLCAYYKPRKCEYMRYCHLKLILEIILYLCGMLAQTSSNCSIDYLVDLVCERLSWCGVPQIYSYISYVGNRLLHVILVIALHDCLTYWSHQESLSMHGGYSYLLYFHLVSYATCILL